MKNFLVSTLVLIASMAFGNAYADCSFGSYNSSYGRNLVSFGITDGTTSQVVSVNQTTSGSIYYDRKSTIFETNPGEEITFSDLTWNGAWMHGYLFVDYNQDGEFNQTLNANGTTGGEVVSYSYYSSTGASNAPNSAGTYVSNGAGLPNASAMPAFTIPSNLAGGTYTARFKVDWNSLDPCGNTTSGNYITTNGGCVVDFTIKINEPKDMEIESISVEKRSGEVNCGEKKIILASVNVKADGGLNPFAVTGFSIKFTGTKLTDISNIRWIYSNSGNLTTEVIAEKESLTRNIASFTANKTLTHGNNYFLLVADVATTATIGNSIKVTVNSITINDTKEELTDNGDGEYIVSNIVDYTKGNAIWFDTPNSSTAGLAIWNTNDFSATATNPDQNWEKKSFPIGNGSLGATIMGAINKERVVMNEKTLWKGGPGTGVTNYWNMNKTVSSSTLQQVRDYLVAGNNSAAHSLVQNNYNGTVSYNKNVFGTFTMMGEAYVETGIDESNVTNYKRIMNMDSSMVVVKFDAGDVGYTRKYFCSYPDSVMVWKFQSKGGTQDLTFSFNCPQNVQSVTEVEGGLLYDCKIDNNGMEWAMRVYVRTNGGGTVATNASTRKITVTGSTDVDFIIAADTDYKMNFNPSFTDSKAFVGVDPIASVNNVINEAKEKSYNQLFNNHREDYCKIFDRVKLSINPNETFENLPTPTRLANYRSGTLDHELEALYFQYGRYLLIACSRAGNMPANLQGMWNNNIDGPWRVDYHNNINLQMNYWPATCTNMLECYQPFIDYVKGLVKPGERTAQAYYGARGWTAEVSTNIFGFTAPLIDSDMSWNYNPTAGPWLTTQIWEYYDYTRDKEWLDEVGYDIIKSSANFVSDLLYYANGSYTSAPSYSPEHGTCDLGATYANAVTREVLIEAIKAAEILNKDADLVAEWKNKLNNMYPYQIGRYGQLQEWYEDIDTYGDQHRHTNHLFGLHPGSTVNPITTPELAEACKETLRQRGDAATGWSMGWKLNHWARLQDGDHAYTLFKNLLKEGTLDNMWDTHPPFQIDGNFGGTAGIAELFLQSQMDTLYILPALPSEWKEGSITGLLARGNFTVDIYYTNNQLDYALVTSNMGEECRIRYNGQKMAFPTVKGEQYRITMENGELKSEITGIRPSVSESVKGGKVKVFPNPNEGTFTVQINGAARGEINLAVFSTLGQQIENITINKESDSIDIPFNCNVNSGSYVVKVNGKGINETQKFLVK